MTQPSFEGVSSGDVLRNQTFGPPPPRRPGSLRRTASIQSFWPEELDGPVAMVGIARDLFTGDLTAAPQLVGNDRISATLSPDWRLLTIEASQRQEIISGFVGLRPSGDLRRAMAKTLPEEGARSTRLHRLLDDMAGGAFMAPAAWHSWLPGGVADYEKATGRESVVDRTVEGVCISFQPGSPAMTPDGRTNKAIADHPFQAFALNDADPWAWHPFAEVRGPNQWRLRRIDLWRQDGLLHVDSGFQDSAEKRGRADGRILFHEYGLHATVHPETLTLLSINVKAAVLPFSTCLAAPATASHLLGQPLSTFRKTVPATLPGIKGCTHLNDMLRALQDVEAMAESLRAHSAIA
jgi:hypothetical protein